MQFKITKVSEESGVDADGRVIQNIRVDFMVGTHGPFVERFKKVEFTSALAQQKLQAFTQQLNALVV